jgi:hypothetical protein
MHQRQAVAIDAIVSHQNPPRQMLPPKPRSLRKFFWLLVLLYLYWRWVGFNRSNQRARVADP